MPLHVTVGFDRTVVASAGHQDLIDPGSPAFEAVLRAVLDAL